MSQYASQQPSGFVNRIRNVAIVGAGGQVGAFIVAELQKNKEITISAITREGSSNPPAAGVQVKNVNYQEISTIVDALKGQDALIITLSVAAPPGTQEILVKAAAEAGVPWVLPNEFGGDDHNKQAGDEAMIAVHKRETRKQIEELGVSKWIGIACSFWYEWSLSGPGLYGIDIAQREVIFFDDGNTKLNTSTWVQTGRGVASLLSLPIYPEDADDKSTTISSYANSFVRVSSWALSQREMFDAVKRVTGTSDSDWNISSVGAKQRYEESKKKLMEGDQRAFAHMMYTRYFFGDDAGYFEKTHGLDNDKLGLPKEDLDEFTKKAVEMANDNYVGKFMGRLSSINPR
ncbi:putative oxidoreductase CipA [Polyplosphaeria fusca]|uniref:Oxidoreductase CipA n=1 Tax=Polyplosphaeria fusca TaxID=682080 RepID=A0A9P4QMT4_9PLEO|nr:putative oxidoreductase CipA [Polyplosphaeria fusca]